MQTSTARSRLSAFPLTPRIPAQDFARARAWYEGKLGLTPTEEEMGGAWYETGGGAFFLFQTPYAGTAQNTAAGWTVKDIEAVMDELRGRGVEFDEVDMGEMGRTQHGLLTLPNGYKAAWLHDSEANILELSEVPG